MTPIYCKFPDEATALTVAAQLAVAANPSLAISVDPETGEETPIEHTVEALPPDGYLAGTYYNIQHVPSPTVPSDDIDPETGEPVLVPVDGYFVIGLWRGPAETIPPALSAFMVDPFGSEWG